MCNMKRAAMERAGETGELHSAHYYDTDRNEPLFAAPGVPQVSAAPRAAPAAAPVAGSVRDGWSAAATALAERAFGHFKMGNYALQGECLQCASMLHDMKPAATQPQPTGPSEREKALEEALARIGRWHGEFPATGKFWPDGSPTSYAAERGSNGERDYMREVAIRALAQPGGAKT